MLRRQGGARRAARSRRPVRTREPGPRAGARTGRAGRRRPEARRPLSARRSRGTERRHFRCTASPARCLRSSGEAARGPSTNTSLRRASTIGNAPTCDPSAARVETPAPGMSRASASPRAAASPIRVLVKLPGPVPTTSAPMSSDVRPALPSRASTSQSRLRAIPTRSPRTWPSSSRALVARSVAVSKESTSISEGLVAAPPRRRRGGCAARPHRRVRGSPKREREGEPKHLPRATRRRPRRPRSTARGRPTPLP